MIRHIKIVTGVLLIGMLFSFTASTKENNKKVAYQTGEALTYRIHYGFFNAGEATIHIHSKIHDINNKGCYRMNIYGKSTGAFSGVIKIRDTWRSYVDTATFLPQKFYRNIQENKYRLKEDMFYYTEQNKVKVQQTKKSGDVKIKEYEVPKDVHDIVSGYYYLRNLNYDEMPENEVVQINAFFEDKLYDFKIKYKGTETVKTKFGKISCHKLIPIMPDQELFDGEESIIFYMSNDENKIPVKIRAEMFVGAVEVDLSGYSGLKYPFKTKKK